MTDFPPELVEKVARAFFGSAVWEEFDWPAQNYYKEKVTAVLKAVHFSEAEAVIEAARKRILHDHFEWCPARKYWQPSEGECTCGYYEEFDALRALDEARGRGAV